MDFTYRELDANFELVLRYGWSVLLLKRKVKQLAASENADKPVSDEHAAELNRIAGFVAAEYRRAQGAKETAQTQERVPA